MNVSKKKFAHILRRKWGSHVHIVRKRNLPVLILNIVTILIVAIMLVVTQATAKTEQTSQALNAGVLSYQGNLMDTEGDPVTGSYDMTFRIYNAMTSTTPSMGGNQVWWKCGACAERVVYCDAG